MKQAIILVGAVVLVGLLAGIAQDVGEHMGVSEMPWLFGGPQAPPVTAPTGEFPSNPALGAQPAV
jgi:hypothetical protein